MGADVTDRAAVQSPWLTIWFSPRISIRRLIEGDVRASWLPVMVLALPAVMLHSIQSLRSTPSLADTPVSLAIFVFIKFEFFILVVGPFLLALVGRWLGGYAGVGSIWQALVWSHAPVAVSGVLWIPVVLVFGNTVFLEALSGPLPSLAIFATQLASLWSSLLVLGMVAEVQRFSLGRAIISYIPFYIALILFVGAMGHVERFVGLR
jgi:hypothetical protein